VLAQPGPPRVLLIERAAPVHHAGGVARVAHKRVDCVAFRRCGAVARADLAAVLGQAAPRAAAGRRGRCCGSGGGICGACGLSGGAGARGARWRRRCAQEQQRLQVRPSVVALAEQSRGGAFAEGPAWRMPRYRVALSAAGVLRALVVAADVIIVRRVVVVVVVLALAAVAAALLAGGDRPRSRNGRRVGAQAGGEGCCGCSAGCGSSRAACRGGSVRERGAALARNRSGGSNGAGGTQRAARRGCRRAWRGVQRRGWPAVREARQSGGAGPKPCPTHPLKRELGLRARAAPPEPRGRRATHVGGMAASRPPSGNA
jgi:hypothetical protein